jgi:hypothetical protein
MARARTYRRRTTPTLEVLETRIVLSQIGENAFLTADGAPAAKGRSSTRVVVGAGELTRRGGPVLVGVVKESSSADATGKAPPTIRSSRRAALQGVEVRKLPARFPGSLQIAKVVPQRSQLQLTLTTRTTAGEAHVYRLFLVGDADGDLDVDKSDLALIRSLNGKRSTSPGYRGSADADGSGRIDRKDFNLARSNVGSRSLVRRSDRAPTWLTAERESAGVIRASGLTATGFNPGEVKAVFTVSGAQFDTAGDSALVLLNGSRVDSDAIRTSASRLEVDLKLAEGVNQLLVQVRDRAGLPVTYERELVAGTENLAVTVLGIGGQPVANATVRASLSSDDRFGVSAVSDASGIARFVNVPRRTVFVAATGPAKESAALGVRGDSGAVTLQFKPFPTLSPIANNDISKGTEGWEIKGGVVTVVDHVPESGAGVAASATSSGYEGVPTTMERNEPASAGPAPDDPAAGGVRLLAETDQDLVLRTSGQGEVGMTRAFEPAKGTKIVKVRYRFITSEVPGGYYGSQYDDYFRITIRTKGGVIATEQKSMNQLGLGAFDFASGATAWREVQVPVKDGEQAVGIEVAVANVADGLYDSSVVVDKIEESKLEISALKLNDIDNSTLQYLSAWTHGYFNGMTRVHGTITVKGGRDDQLTSLVLEVLEGGNVIATGQLAPAAKTALIGKKFGASGELKIATSQRLFDIASSQFPLLTRAGNNSLELRVKAESSLGFDASESAGNAKVLVRYTNGNRYGQRDTNVGGDDWVLPVVRSRMEQVAGVVWGDMSNMNGGGFPPHGSHRDGVDADGWFAGYNARNAATAATLLAHLNNPDYGRYWQIVYVTFTPTANPAFYNAIKDVTLADGRKATSVILNYADHDTHFHVRWSS